MEKHNQLVRDKVMVKFKAVSKGLSICSIHPLKKKEKSLA